MKRILTKIILITLLISCNKKSENVLKIKEFKTNHEDTYSIYSNYKNETVRFNKLVASFNSINNLQDETNFIINFKTNNFFNHKEIDSTFLIMYPYKNENIGENDINIFLINSVHTNNKTWINKPSYDSTAYVYLPKNIETTNVPLKINITNLVKKHKAKFGYDLPLFFKLNYKVTNSQQYREFFSGNNENEHTKRPLLKVYYH